MLSKEESKDIKNEVPLVKCQWCSGFKSVRSWAPRHQSGLPSHVEGAPEVSQSDTVVLLGPGDDGSAQQAQSGASIVKTHVTFDPGLGFASSSTMMDIDIDIGALEKESSLEALNQILEGVKEMTLTSMANMGTCVGMCGCESFAAPVDVKQEGSGASLFKFVTAKSGEVLSWFPSTLKRNRRTSVENNMLVDSQTGFILVGATPNEPSESCLRPEVVLKFRGSLGGHTLAVITNTSSCGCSLQYFGDISAYIDHSNIPEMAPLVLAKGRQPNCCCCYTQLVEFFLFDPDKDIENENDEPKEGRTKSSRVGGSGTSDIKKNFKELEKNRQKSTNTDDWNGVVAELEDDKKENITRLKFFSDDLSIAHKTTIIFMAWDIHTQNYASGPFGRLGSRGRGNIYAGFAVILCFLVMDLQRVEKAIREGKIFEVRGDVTSGSESARQALLKRGWIEKPKLPKNSARPSKGSLGQSPKLSVVSKHSIAKQGLNLQQSLQTQGALKLLEGTYSQPDSSKTSSQRSEQESSPNSSQRSEGPKNAAPRSSGQGMANKPSLKVNSGSIVLQQKRSVSDSVKALRLLNDTPANMIWADTCHIIKWPVAFDFQLINMHPQDDYLLKKNLIEPIRDVQWIGCEPKVYTSGFPRTYRLYLEEEMMAFVNDYRLTACMSLLRWTVNTIQFDQKEGVVDNEASSILFQLVDFAVLQLRNYVRIRKHEDLDDTEEDWTKLPMEWDKFLSQGYQMTHRESKLRITPINSVHSMYKKVTGPLVDVQPFWPQSAIDGWRNIWIMKPGEGMRGVGIVVLDNYDEISRRFLNPQIYRTTWIVQKYIERPLLVYKTKVDMRQWYLITSWNPLTVWIYRQSYVRFSSQQFSLNSLDQKIHLTNNTLQMQFKLDPNRDPALPANNIWTSTEFQEYLKKIGKAEVWHTVIYARIKEIIMAVLFAARHFIIDRPNSFTIQGVDFMLAEDFSPWMLEINSTPLLTNFSSVAAKLCPKCIQDALKVVLDWKNGTNPRANTGDFELLYREKRPLLPPIAKLNAWHGPNPAPTSPLNPNLNQSSNPNPNRISYPNRISIPNRISLPNRTSVPNPSSFNRSSSFYANPVENENQGPEDPFLVKGVKVPYKKLTLAAETPSPGPKS